MDVRVTRTEEVIDRVREMVLQGEFPPGAHLQEVTLAAALGVSRTPIRDALRVLGQEQLLTYAPNRGYFVSGTPAKDVLDAYDLRAMVEGMACRLCAEQGIPESTMNELRENLKEAEEIFAGGRKVEEWGPLNTKFHLALAEASGNKHLIAVAKQMRRIPRIFDNRLEPNAEFFRSVYTHERRRYSLHEHNAILDAIENRQGSRAEHLMREHVYRNREAMRQKLESLERGDPAFLPPARGPTKTTNGARPGKKAVARPSNKPN